MLRGPDDRQRRQTDKTHCTLGRHTVPPHPTYRPQATVATTRSIGRNHIVDASHPMPPCPVLRGAREAANPVYSRTGPEPKFALCAPLSGQLALIGEEPNPRNLTGGYSLRTLHCPHRPSRQSCAAVSKLLPHTACNRHAARVNGSRSLSPSAEATILFHACSSQRNPT